MPASQRPAALRVAIAGTGFIGAVHARSARLAGAEVVGVAASTPERSIQAAAALGVPRAFDSADELAVADGVDVVHICTPNDLHAPLAEAALNAGKHVVCEKPLALDGDEAARLVALAEQSSGRVATVPFVYRYNPVVVEARAWIAQGELGPVRLVHGGYIQDWLSRPEDDSWRVDPQKSGSSRAFADIGSHWCDLLEFVTGERIEAVIAQTATVIPERAEQPGGRAFGQGAAADAKRRHVTTEDLATVMLRTRSGVLGTMLVSQVSPGRKNHLHLEVACAEASVRFEQEWPETLWVGRRERTEHHWRDPALLAPEAARLSVAPAGHAQGYLDCFDNFVADTYAAIAGDAPEILPRFADGARANRLVDAVMASAQNGAWVDVPA